MLNLLATDEFADWFRALADRDAEDVATALEVLAALSVEQANSSSSDLLLWYRALPEEIPPSKGPGLNVSDTFHRVTARIFRVLRHLESETVQARTAELSIECVIKVRSAIRRIREQVRRNWRLVLTNQEAEAKRVLADVERDYREALEAVGLQDPAAPVHGGSLRQLHINERPPGMRILYGVDSQQRTVLLVLGEYLDRRAYGSSVRTALSVWERFLADNDPSGLGPSRTSSRAL